jgi:DNA polymerase IV
MGAQAALGRRQATPDLIRETLGYLVDRVAGRLRKANMAGRTVTVRVRFTQLRSVTRSATLPVAISTTLTLTEVADQLAHSAMADNREEREITLLAVSVSNLRPEHSLQLELPLDRRASGSRPESVIEASRWGVDRSVDAIREKFGRTAVGYAAASLSGADRVPEEFRELAERGLKAPGTATQILMRTLGSVGSNEMGRWGSVANEMSTLRHAPRSGRRWSAFVYFGVTART